MIESTALGAPIEGIDQGHVIEVLAVAKVFYDDGQVGYEVRATDGLTGVEAIGMAEYTRHALLTHCLEDED